MTETGCPTLWKAFRTPTATDCPICLMSTTRGWRFRLALADPVVALVGNEVVHQLGSQLAALDGRRA